ncbi:hypothetical protein NECAME_17910 [Necator americanus]|uniref:Uncharacterized protein n=1 Tax=Necator americanus TaxID=51031 RepID=W2THS2_NECAM|nr:hypothetical protein NECAME_17910 [Necator americanus]ETN81353.1 hypothetical protein NECAME_17910 [Necator americanus]
MRLLPQSIAAALYRNPATFAAVNCRLTSGLACPMQKQTFRPKKVLILSKVTRYEFEKRLHNNADDKQLEIVLGRRGSDYNLLFSKHEIHHAYLKTIQSELEYVSLCTMALFFEFFFVFCSVLGKTLCDVFSLQAIADIGILVHYSTYGAH